MATLQSVERQATRLRAQSGHPVGGARFDWAMVGLSALFLAGLWVDGWAHFHGEVDGSFFTPWHFLFYGAFGTVALFLGYHQVRNVNRGYAFRRALPVGYGLSLLGVGVFALSGFADMIWHTLFGIEGGSEALMSPSHIGLAIGMTWVFAGPVRAAWFRANAERSAHNWANLGPIVIGSSMLVTLAMFFTSYANPVVTPVVLYGRRSASEYQDFGVATILMMAAILTGFILPMVRRWRVPFGTFTLMFTLSTALLTVLNDAFIFIIGAAVAGLVTDVLAARWQPAAGGAWRLLMVTFAAPALYFAGYFATVRVIEGTMPWSIHVWTGAIVIAGMVGTSLALMVMASAAPNRDQPAA
ncbi:MAG: hypothetical protein MUC99_05695 [Anaerolineae bacterium]|jgi:hypothetical protein|nr:hypothetical protein [Anaerolineae bacterium]